MVFHPSSGTQNTVSTVSGIIETCTVDTVLWVKYHPKYVEQVTVLNKLYSVASCWIIIAKLLALSNLSSLHLCSSNKLGNIGRRPVLLLCSRVSKYLIREGEYSPPPKKKAVLTPAANRLLILATNVQQTVDSYILFIA